MMTIQQAPPAIRAIWCGTGHETALEHLVTKGAGWEAAAARLMVTMRRRRAAVTRFQNRVVRSRILAAIADGHAFVSREMGGRSHVALDYGPGKCSSSFVLA